MILCCIPLNRCYNPFLNVTVLLLDSYYTIAHMNTIVKLGIHVQCSFLFSFIQRVELKNKGPCINTSDVDARILTTGVSTPSEYTDQRL